MLETTPLSSTSSWVGAMFPISSGLVIRFQTHWSHLNYNDSNLGVKSSQSLNGTRSCQLDPMLHCPPSMWEGQLCMWILQEERSLSIQGPDHHYARGKGPTPLDLPIHQRLAWRVSDYGILFAQAMSLGIFNVSIIYLCILNISILSWTYFRLFLDVAILLIFIGIGLGHQGWWWSKSEPFHRATCRASP